jgi:hypothetical protein
VYGIGPIGAAIIIGHTQDITRFPGAGHYARYNGTTPLKRPPDRVCATA